MIYRDDDIGKYTDLTTIMRIQDLFDKHDKVHTVTVLMENLWESRGVWEWLVTTPNLDIALHGWIHADHNGMTEGGQERMLRQAVKYWNHHNERMGIHIPLKVFYPPWNSYNEHTRRVCSELGMELNVCVDPTKVYNFHWWQHIGGRGLDRLEKVLEHGLT